MKTKKSHWNYRLLYHESAVDSSFDGRSVVVPGHFQFHEVFYSKGKPDGYSKGHLDLSFDTPEDVADFVEKIKIASKKPILFGGKKFPKIYKKKKQPVDQSWCHATADMT